MTIFRNFKNQSAFYNHIYYHVSRISIKQFEIIVHYSKKLKNKRVVKIDKKTTKLFQLFWMLLKVDFLGLKTLLIES